MDQIKLFDVILSESLWLNSAIITVVIRIAWFLISELLNKIRFLRMSKLQIFHIPCGPHPGSILGINRFYCLVVRYGTDNYIRYMANDKEKYDGKLQNKVLPMKVLINCREYFSIELKLPVHKRIGTQFKCFVEVDDKQKLDEFRLVLDKCSRIYDISISSSRFKNRIYFLLQDFSTVETIEGIKNNMCFPE